MFISVSLQHHPTNKWGTISDLFSVSLHYCDGQVQLTCSGWSPSLYMSSYPMMASVPLWAGGSQESNTLVSDFTSAFSSVGWEGTGKGDREMESHTEHDKIYIKYCSLWVISVTHTEPSVLGEIQAFLYTALPVSGKHYKVKKWTRSSRSVCDCDSLSAAILFRMERNLHFPKSFLTKATTIKASSWVHLLQNALYLRWRATRLRPRGSRNISC